MTPDAVTLCLAGTIAPAVALARLTLGGMTPDQIEPHLPPGSDLARLFAQHRGNLAVVGEMLRASGTDHATAFATSTEELARTRAMFDRAVALAPEASVAAYSLNDPALLQAATAEIVDWLRDHRLISPNTDVLDLGCGIGRVAAALAPHVRSVLGLDLSPGMIATARARSHAANLRYQLTDGTPATGLPDASLDLVIAVDSFPYLVQANIAAAHVAEAARLLRAGGRLVILNLSYRDDPEADRRDFQAWSTNHGFTIEAAGTTPFKTWDGKAHVGLRKSGQEHLL